jgi:type IV pilus assembly protein PilN
MILINLLPHREEKRRRRKQAFFAALGLSAVAGALVVGGWYTVLQQLISNQQERNAYLTAEIKKLDEQIKDIATLRAEIDALKARQRAVEDLQTDRNMPVHLLNELVKQTPEGVYLSNIKQTGQTVTITGVAQTNERVSELLRNTAYNSPWLERPELVEIKAANVQAADKRGRDAEQRRLFEFSMRVSLKRPQDAAAKDGDVPAAPPGTGARAAPAKQS